LKPTHVIRSRFYVVSLSLALTFLLSGCIAYQAASMVAGAAVGTVSAVGRAISRAATSTSSAVSRSVQQIPARMMYGPAPRRYVIPVRNTRTTTAARTTRTSTTRAPTSSAATAAQKKALKKMSKQRSEILEVLPPELLNQLTEGQLTLQAIVQADALEGPGKETVFWEYEGRAGTATSEEPHRMGSFTCRVLVETLKLEDASEEATESRATACKTDTTGWTLSF